VYVEAFRNNPDSKIKPVLQTYIKETNIKASPEIIDSYWLNSQGKKVIATGFETNIQLYIETLGLIDETINLQLFDYDGVFTDDSLLWDGQASYGCTIDNRKFSVPYDVKPANSPDYANGQSWFEGNLEVYVNISFDNPSLPITIEDRYANINFTPDKKANLFLAKKEEVFVNNILYIQYNKIESVYPGMTAYLVAETANLNGTVTFSITEETPLLVSSGVKLPLLVGTNSQTDFTATVVDDFAVVQVKFQEVDSTTYNSWNTSLDNESEEGLFSKLQIKASIGTDEYDSNSELKLKSSVIRYIIKPDGSIIKHHRDISSHARYIYIKNQQKHYLLKRETLTINWVEKDKRSRLTQNYIYKKKKIKLIKVNEGDAYDSGTVKFKFLKVNSTSRKYIDSDCLACLLAAMIENNIEDLRFNGFSTSTGKSGDSQSHWNGMVGDLGYLNINKDASSTWLSSSNTPYSSSPNWLNNLDFDYDRQILFNNSLYKYGFSKFKRLNNQKVVKMLSENFIRKINDVNETKLLPHTKHYRTTNTFHFHHLHLQGLDISFFEIKK